MTSVEDVFHNVAMLMNEEIFVMADISELSESQLTDQFDAVEESFQCHSCEMMFTLKRNLMISPMSCNNSILKCEVCEKECIRNNLNKYRLKPYQISYLI